MENKGRYIYGVAAGDRAISLGTTGIEGSEVYTVPYGGLCAIVHSCPAEPYRSGDGETVKKWVKAHQEVLDRAKAALGDVIPMSFDTILQPRDEAVAPDQAVKDWLREDGERLRSVMDRIQGRDEYIVQVFYDPAIMAKQISEGDQDIRKIKEEMALKGPGTAYLFRQKIEKAVRAEMERLAGALFKNFYARVRRHCTDVVIEKTRRGDGSKVMLVNFSCLATAGQAAGLGEELDKINKKEGFSVHFSGPWPPYSFVARPVFPSGETWTD